MGKPKFLYHASRNRSIDIFEPRAESVRDLNEGPVVFATSDKTLASMFIVPTDDTWTSKGLYSGVHCFVCSDELRFKGLDKGGAIYTLPPDTFDNDPDKGLGTREWTSKLPVRPLRKEVYESGLEVMINKGVQIYFLDQQQFQKFQKLKRSPDHGIRILRKSISENLKRGKNVRELPERETD